MAESYEVVFQEVPRKNLFLLLRKMKMNASFISNINISSEIEISKDFEMCESLINDIIDNRGDICLIGEFHGFVVSEKVSIKSVLLRVVKYGVNIDVELSFDDDGDVSIDDLMKELHQYAKKISEEFDVGVFYGGLEPAMDINTRYFTNDVVGPMGC